MQALATRARSRSRNGNVSPGQDGSVSADPVDLYLFNGKKGTGILFFNGKKGTGNCTNLDGQGSMLHSFSFGLGFTFSG